MKSIQEIFPRASASTVALNPHLCDSATVSPKTKQNTIQPIVATKRRSVMNKTEAEYALILESMKRKGEILRYEYQGITLRWFDMRYTPDFFVHAFEYNDATRFTEKVWKLIEVKGPHIHYRQQAMARFKGARGFWPEFTFEMHQKTKEGWKQII